MPRIDKAIKRDEQKSKKPFKFRLNETTRDKKKKRDYKSRERDFRDGILEG